MAIKKFETHHLVTGADTNHHGTLFAGRGAAWFVEAGFVAAASMTCTAETVCATVHGMVFNRPVKKGSILRFDSRVVYTGRSSLVVYVDVVTADKGEFVVDGFLTFIHVDETGHSAPHGIVVEPETEEEKELYERASKLRRPQNRSDH
ncbi:acyl-CoA thioesterase [Anaeroarcus burkinensis]|uniref:acyl-CoA thioesterase n=1 Tax=Anaeroarcus burkinensis TaxID=82376 RepID=UPI00040AF82C|nr:hotdog domain-containing protein [Anaeroarcus burkinensis]